ncbi:hypothetical protein EDWATA_00192 [Edwardsiella tarda ATCC 23685]|uniref:Uncharacterized protein n=1 Tax=Edwardsiella tarda ATCC 23685 TaxID=500638 RepID=D4F0G8_EDWTA|nr:hypothetical protein EDWATA_00192 [Edwardsiella tarda ATCC 23685]
MPVLNKKCLFGHPLCVFKLNLVANGHLFNSERVTRFTLP